MLFPVEDCLVEVTDGPALGHRVGEEVAELLGRGLGHRIAPGPEGDEEGVLFVKGEVAVHHGADAERLEAGEGNTILPLHVSLQGGKARLKSLFHFIKTIGPHPVYEAVLPVEAALGDRLVALVDEDRLDAGRAELDAEDRLSVGDKGFCLGVHLSLLGICFALIRTQRRFTTTYE